MTIVRMILLMGIGIAVSACAPAEMPTRNAPLEQAPDGSTAAPTVIQGAAAIVPGQSPVTVNRVIVNVPNSLKVSEANLYLPFADIVWREDPMGDRHAQVKAIVQSAIEQGVAPLDGPANVDLYIQVTRFHALTQKARYTIGGVHSITFNLAVKHPKTGELLMPVRSIQADLEGYGGKQALKAEANGQTQKVRITNHLAGVIRQELTSPEGYENANLGFYQMLNNL